MQTKLDDIKSDFKNNPIYINDFQKKFNFKESKKLEVFEGSKINKFLSIKFKTKVNFNNWHRIESYEDFVPIGVSLIIKEALDSGFSKDDIYIVDPDFTNSSSDPALLLRFRRNKKLGYWDSTHETYDFLIPIIWLKNE